MRFHPLLGALVLCLACAESAATIFDAGDIVPDAGMAPDSGHAALGASCNPATASSCTSALICDAQSGVCRLPRYGEACDPSVGCASVPMGMQCLQATYAGSALQACLIPCTSQDSSNCPYGTSCGDPNLPGYCSAQGSGGCTPGSTCALGPGLAGTCVAVGTQNACLADGEVLDRYGACNPDATNAQSSALCGAGFICEAESGGLGSDPSDGFCFPICQAQSDCLDSEHCAEGSTFRLGLCRPGIACSLDSAACGAWAVCVPDSADGLGGGCLQLVSNPGQEGQACQPPQTPTDAIPCVSGACLAIGDGGPTCQALCQLNGGKPVCPSAESCQSLSQAPAAAVLGVCE
jgi:hypothetical protein